MHAVRFVDLQSQLLLVAVDRHVFVDAGGAEARLGAIVTRQIDGRRNRRVLELQVARLLLLVVGVATADVGKEVEADLAILQKDQSIHQSIQIESINQSKPNPNRIQTESKPNGCRSDVQALDR